MVDEKSKRKLAKYRASQRSWKSDEQLSFIGIDQQDSSFIGPEETVENISQRNKPTEPESDDDGRVRM